MIRKFIHRDAVTARLLRALNSFWLEPRKFCDYQVNRGMCLVNDKDMIVLFEASSTDEYNEKMKRIRALLN